MSHKITLKDAYKGYTLDQDKIISPEETVRRFKEKLKGVDLDILERTVRIDTGRLGIPVYFSICGKDALQVIGTVDDDAVDPGLFGIHLGRQHCRAAVPSHGAPGSR